MFGLCEFDGHCTVMANCRQWWPQDIPWRPWQWGLQL